MSDDGHLDPQPPPPFLRAVASGFGTALGLLAVWWCLDVTVWAVRLSWRLGGAVAGWVPAGPQLLLAPLLAALLACWAIGRLLPRRPALRPQKPSEREAPGA